MAITWGQNTTHTFPTFVGGTPAAAPTTTAFGAAAAPSPAAPAPPGAAPASSGFSFGGTPAATAPASTGFSFGGTPAAAAPSGGGLFGGGTTPAPSPGGLFGASAPAASSFAFGSTAPSTGGLFGSGSGTTTFGSTAFGSPAPTGGIFGQQPLQQQAPPQPQIPAQAALQAHMDASARQEEARVQQHLEQINRAYTCTAPAKSSTKSSDFCEILYNPATPEYQQQQWLHGLGVDGRARPILPPNKPPQVAQRAWEEAVVRNPDRLHYMPIAVVGATALQARLTGQQEQVNETLKQLETLKESHNVTRDRYERAGDQLKSMALIQDQQRKRLMDIMRRVEVTRCYNNPLQTDEIKAMQKAVELYRQVEQLADGLRVVEDQARTTVTQQPSRPSTADQMIALPDKEQLKEVLKEHRAELSKCTTMMDKDLRDLNLISRRVESVSKVSLLGPPRP